MNITTAKRIAKNPVDYSEADLHEALDFIVSDDRITEKTLGNMQHSIEAELNSRKGVYPVGTNVRDIKYFNRGIKVLFACKEHPQYEYMSKDPFSSQMFPANKAAQDLQWGNKDECNHTLRDDVWFTTSVYDVNE